MMVQEVKAYKSEVTGQIFMTRIEALVSDATNEITEALGEELMDQVTGTFPRDLVMKAYEISKALAPVIEEIVSCGSCYAGGVKILINMQKADDVDDMDTSVAQPPPPQSDFKAAVAKIEDYEVPF